MFPIPAIKLGISTPVCGDDMTPVDAEERPASLMVTSDEEEENGEEEEGDDREETICVGGKLVSNLARVLQNCRVSNIPSPPL